MEKCKYKSLNSVHYEHEPLTQHIVLRLFYKKTSLHSFMLVNLFLLFVCLFVCVTPKQQAKSSSRKDQHVVLRATTLAHKLQIKLAIPHSSTILTLGQSVIILTV